MKNLPFVAALVSTLWVVNTSAQAPIVPEDAVLEVVSEGDYRFVEGPALAPDGSIYFTDIPNGHIHRYDPATGKTSLFVDDSGGANGLMFDPDGDALWACAGRARQVYLYHHAPADADSPKAQVLSPEPDRVFVPAVFGDKRWNSPNDLTMSEAGVYFTDPRYGNRDNMEMRVEGVYFLRPGLHNDGLMVERVIDDLVRPNGIGISPDFKTLYVADNGDKKMWAYPILEPGKVGEGWLLNDLGDYERGPDGMTVDHAGRVYTTIFGEGVLILSPEGQRLGFIETGPQTTNCTFGADGKTLYVTAEKSLKRIVLNTGAD